MTYSKDFIEALRLAKGKGLFLGTGNPNSSILIIGKEAAIDIEKNPQQYKLEVLDNVSDWEENIKLNNQFEDIDNWLTEVGAKYNPLYPYKGQRNTVEMRSSDGTIKRGLGGTSKTWYNYQKLINHIYEDGKKSDWITFHENAFITELSQETAKYSNLLPKDKREESIEKRKLLFDTPFFKTFPIIIVAVGHYVRDLDIDLQKVFEVTYDQKKSMQYSEGLNKEYINIHFDSKEHPTRLLIHTNQLSMVSNKLIETLGIVCKLFQDKKLIYIKK